MNNDAETIEITINGFKEKATKGSSITELILKYDEMESAMMVERNGKFVYPQDYDGTFPDAGDVLEFIHPDFGG
ncbi:MAG: MoaD/ThiS family protein [Deltaproteobacteria bacterium]|jgi:sulfur carrier protein ThiS|nr:MoaD/ThiS family protein [Deltaproteobacteria bacterium]